MLWKGPWGEVIFVEMDPFSFDNICSRCRGRLGQTALVTGGYREALWLMIKLIVCQSAPDKLKCPQLFILGCPMLLCSWVKMSQWYIWKLSPWGWQQKVKATVCHLVWLIKPQSEVLDSRRTKVFLVGENCSSPKQSPHVSFRLGSYHVVFLHHKLSFTSYYLFIANWLYMSEWFDILTR